MSALRPTVEAAWRSYNEDLEGVFSCPYFDIRRLITTAIGVLVDPVERCLTLDWRIGDKAATPAQIRDDFKTLKDMAERMTDAELKRWPAARQAPYTSIRLRAETINDLVRKRLHANVDYIVQHYFPDFAEWPADAQMGTLSLVWGVGAGLTLTSPPRTMFVDSCRARNWALAKVHARMRTDNNPGVIDRNAKQDICFDNAALVDARRLDPSWLWWPNKTPESDSLKTVALKAVELGIARETKPPKA